MKTNILPAIRLTAVCVLFFGVFYTLAVWSVAQVVPGKGKGHTRIYNGKVQYMNVGQDFSEDRYFWSRPSATDYNAAGSGGSNHGPSNPAHLKEVEDRITHFLDHNPEVKRADLPAELVTASGSGLDPHLSVAAAQIQVKRIAKVRQVSEENLLKLIEKHTQKPLLGFLGPEYIHALELNYELDMLESI
ncbi:potassium-transporting ATPase subunit C [Arundinibacter roseus]|uniref:Potassium-transporting ATPase KdpC subunit n=1 Tax=Arundinibacter roseus TaxID=2070510 RepID=A0A4R4KKU2_9BACT|nr:potassium-transporting ATPase subunit C [Arundinibacter roseus]TDB68917.1 potassium-transporting ATPase subunit C [Arundinibacter roseus]